MILISSSSFVYIFISAVPVHSNSSKYNSFSIISLGYYVQVIYRRYVNNTVIDSLYMPQSCFSLIHMIFFLIHVIKMLNSSYLYCLFRKTYEWMFAHSVWQETYIRKKHCDLPDLLYLWVCSVWLIGTLWFVYPERLYMII